MAVHDLSGGAEVLEGIRLLAQEVLGRYELHPEATLELINVSENATFLVSEPAGGRRVTEPAGGRRVSEPAGGRRVPEPAGGRWVLRVHRLGYHSSPAIASELAWMDALRSDAGIRTPKVIAARDGSRVVTMPDHQAGRLRSFVMFEYLAGQEPAPDDVDSFERLGTLSARMHNHARGWTRPKGFTRFHWDYEGAFGAEARWGRWQHGIGVGRPEKELLARLDAVLDARLRRYGTGPQRYGLVHADIRVANLLVDGPAVSVIDFDDCGFGWYLYDLGTSLSFFEHEPYVPALIDSWLRGYRAVTDLSADDEAEVWTFIMFRRLLLLAWIGTHQGAEIARQLGPSYTAGTCALAEDYLGRLA